jgi:hypothetical protein
MLCFGLTFFIWSVEIIYKVKGIHQKKFNALTWIYIYSFEIIIINN